MNLTKRETIAAMAMQGVLAATNQDDCHPHCVASWAVELTDALISELTGQRRSARNARTAEPALFAPSM